jgi:hypothetical protein
VETAPLPIVDARNLELARLEGAMAGRHDERPGRERLALVRRHEQDLLAVHPDALEAFHLLVEMDVRAELEALLDAEVDERLALDLRVPGDVVDVLLRVDGSDLATELAEALDDADGGVAVPRVVGGSKANGARADDRDVDDVVLAHSEARLPGKAQKPASLRR